MSLEQFSKGQMAGVYNPFSWPHSDYLLESWHLVAHSLDQGEQFMLDHNGRSFGVRKLVGDLTRFVGRIDGAKDSTNASDGVARDDEFGSIRHEQADTLTLLDSKR